MLREYFLTNIKALYQSTAIETKWLKGKNGQIDQWCESSRKFTLESIYLLQIECTDCTLKSLNIFAHLTIQEGTLRLLFHAKQSLLTLHIFPTSSSDTRSRKLYYYRAYLQRSGPSDIYPFWHKHTWSQEWHQGQSSWELFRTLPTLSYHMKDPSKPNR